MAGRRLRREDYTVGRVCALPVELAAAQEMLDEEHQDLPQNDNDANIYTLGRIGEHNVVMACLPEGQTGTNSAAAIAVRMKLAFTLTQEQEMAAVCDRNSSGVREGILSVIPVAEVAKSRTADEIMRENALEIILNRLPNAEDAPFNSYSKQHQPTCLSDTRVDLLKEIYNWADGQDERCIFWLNGLAGTGKSTTARTVARKYFERGGLGASFFSRGGEDVSLRATHQFYASASATLLRSVATLRANPSATNGASSSSVHEAGRQRLPFFICSSSRCA
ncbi:hypothetical protein DL770_010934 [Monosporascus sp. CRB-9-2]|nr:hypothetical protein DL770_010934 [Monosporascus sp. CRB-9-2]